MNDDAASPGEPEILGTREVARRLGLKPGTLSAAVWRGSISEPRRSPAGDFLWTRADMERACRELLHRSLDEVIGRASVERQG